MYGLTTLTMYSIHTICWADCGLSLWVCRVTALSGQTSATEKLRFQYDMNFMSFKIKMWSLQYPLKIETLPPHPPTPFIVHRHWVWLETSSLFLISLHSLQGPCFQGSSVLFTHIHSKTGLIKVSRVWYLENMSVCFLEIIFMTFSVNIKSISKQMECAIQWQWHHTKWYNTIWHSTHSTIYCLHGKVCLGLTVMHAFYTMLPQRSEKRDRKRERISLRPFLALQHSHGIYLDNVSCCILYSLLTRCILGRDERL